MMFAKLHRLMRQPKSGHLKTRHRQALAFLALVWIGVLIAATRAPIYEADAIVLVKPTARDGSDTTAVAASLRPEQMSRPQLTIIGSEDIIRRAVKSVGEEKILGDTPRFSFWGGKPRLSPADAAYLLAAKNLQVRTEPQTDLLRVSFRDHDPRLAADFVNQIISAFAVKYSQLYDNRGAAEFFRNRKKLSDEQVATASARMIDFSVNKSVFFVTEQRRLLLERRNNLAAAIASTNGLIADKDSRATIIPTQLAQMKPVGRLPQITGLAQVKPATEASAAISSDATIERLSKDPPMLLVRVYQDTIADLVKLQTDLAGLHALVDHQTQQLGKVNEELVSLSNQEAEFDRLRTEVDRAKRSADVLSKRAQEEALAQELNESDFASVQIVQTATTPLKPIWPHIPTILAIGLLLSAAPFAAIYMFKFLTRERQGAGV